MTTSQILGTAATAASFLQSTQENENEQKDAKSQESFPYLQKLPEALSKIDPSSFVSRAQHHLSSKASLITIFVVGMAIMACSILGAGIGLAALAIITFIIGAIMVSITFAAAICIISGALAPQEDFQTSVVTPQTSEIKQPSDQPDSNS